MAARPKSTQERADEIQARSGAVSSTGMLNPRVVSLEEARTIAQAQAEAEQAAGPQPQPKVVGPLQAVRNVAFRTAFTEDEIRNLPGFLQPLARAGNELTSPAAIAFTAATAGLGPALAKGLGGIALSAAEKKLISMAAPGLLTAAKVSRGAIKAGLEPIARGGFGQRFGAEQAFGTLAGAGTELAGEAIPETAPTPVKIAGALAGGLVAGAGGLTGFRAMTRAIPETLVRVPQRQVQETGLRLAGMPGGMAGGAEARFGGLKGLRPLKVGDLKADRSVILADGRVGMLGGVQRYTEGPNDFIVWLPDETQITVKAADVRKHPDLDEWQAQWRAGIEKNQATWSPEKRALLLREETPPPKPVAPVTERRVPARGGMEGTRQAEPAGGVVRKEAAEDIAAAPSPAPVAAKVPVRRTRTTKPAPSRVEARAAPVEAAGVVPPSPAAAPPAVPPRRPPTAAGGTPPADPIESRPRTLLDMNREAKGMRAMTPEQRAAVMDLAKPIKGDILYQARPFNEHAQNLLGPDTNFMKALRSVPGLKQVFGAWNPAQMARDNPQAMIGLRQSIFQEIEKARIRFATLRWWHDADTAFAFKRTGTAYGARPTTGVWRSTTVKPASPNVARGKMFGTINDMIEHPERYAFTEDQSRVLSLADNTLTQSVRDAQRVGVNVVELAEDYWPRVITKGPKGEKGLGIARKRISSAKGYTHQRVFSDIDDLVEAGYVVETDPRRVLASRLEAGVDTVAHANARKQIAALPGVEKPLERMERRFPQVLESARGAREARDAAKATVKSAGTKVTPEQVMALRQAEADYITAMRDVYAKKIEVGTPGYYELRLPNGRIAPQELVEQVGKLIDLPELRQPGVGGAAALTREVSQLLRTTLTNVDMAAGFIQGQSLFYRNNVAWWKAQAQAIVALIDDPTAYIAKNFDIMDEGVRTAAIVAPTEYLFAKQGLASIPLRIPYIGPVLGSFNRAFEWFITAGQTELYKAARSGVAKNAGMDELVSLGSAIRKEVGTESYAILGVRPNQRTFEALSLFAARYFRAMVGALGQSFTPGPGGAEARKAVGSLLAGGTALTIGIKWAQDKELPNMTDPYAPDWMQWRWGKTYYNAYGPFYPYLRTMARMSVAFAEGDPKKAGAALTRFLESKESLPLRALDIAGQLAYYGTANVYGTTIERTWASIAKGILSEFVTPISIQEIPSGIAEGRPESLLEFPGLIGRPVRLASEWRKDLEEYFDIPSDSLELTMGQQSRTEYRERHPEVDAKLFITGQVSSLQTSSSVREAARLIQESGIDPDSIRGIKVRKEDLAQAQKVGKKLEKTAVDRLIAALESQPKSPAPSAPSSTPPPTAVPGSGGSLLEWTRQRRQGTPAPAGAR